MTTKHPRARVKARSPEGFERWRRLAAHRKKEPTTPSCAMVAGRSKLKQMSPTQVKEGQKTVEMVAVAMLNRELRQEWSKWHPLLTAFESENSEASDRNWEHNQEFRSSLEQLRQRLLAYAVIWVAWLTCRDSMTSSPIRLMGPATPLFPGANRAKSRPSTREAIVRARETHATRCGAPMDAPKLLHPVTVPS